MSNQWKHKGRWCGNKTWPVNAIALSGTSVLEPTMSFDVSGLPSGRFMCPTPGRCETFRDPFPSGICYRYPDAMLPYTCKRCLVGDPPDASALIFQISSRDAPTPRSQKPARHITVPNPRQPWNISRYSRCNQMRPRALGSWWTSTSRSQRQSHLIPMHSWWHPDSLRDCREHCHNCFIFTYTK